MACKQCDELKKTKRELKEAKKLLKALAAHATATAQNAAREMGVGEVPRGRYAYLKGEFETGNTILQIMNLQPVLLQNRRQGSKLFGRLFDGLFGG